MSDFKFLYWDDPGDSQEEATEKDNNLKDWQKEIIKRELGDSEKEEQQRDIYDDDDQHDPEWHRLKNHYLCAKSTAIPQLRKPNRFCVAWSLHQKTLIGWR